MMFYSSVQQEGKDENKRRFQEKPVPKKLQYDPTWVSDNKE